MTTATIDSFTRAYVECALWSSCDENDEPLDSNYGIEDMASAALAACAEDCADFRSANSAALAESNLSDESAGHDFWLTRNGHGAGFWDRGLGAVGTVLSDAARVYGSVDLYVGDDGMVYARWPIIREPLENFPILNLTFPLLQCKIYYVRGNKQTSELRGNDYGDYDEGSGCSESTDWGASCRS